MEVTQADVQHLMDDHALLSRVTANGEGRCVTRHMCARDRRERWQALRPSLRPLCGITFRSTEKVKRTPSLEMLRVNDNIVFI
ncbi:unnamed protein product [Dicrocoelium dendriticum]|nr:unnamed protein product [Dicrocoelium dendriticum]